ncbi:MAG: [FeFe] hydrogenase H-cluster maturation GTPase HydF [Limisphaerales bacterium]|nr:[FeFe] hydrogenase H-cluster maturation GTPase HydF [Verrucomicrobiota bacterium]
MKTPKTFRLHIGIFGRRNVGKSSLLNCLTRQQTAIVSATPGTTTDPVEKPMELPAIGPVLFIDTAGVDDEGSLGSLRVAKTRQVIERTDLALLVVEAGNWSTFEETLFRELSAQNLPTVIVFNKSDLSEPAPELIERLSQESKTASVIFCARNGRGISELFQALIQHIPDEFINRPSIAADLVPEGRCAILVTPVDKAAPKGRLILPEVQTIRDLLDANRFIIVCRESELPLALSRLNEKPAIVITDSQAFKTVNELTPADIPLTGFSVLFARLQGDLNEMTRGALSIDRLKPGDKVLIAEACTHHPVQEDIGTVKIPRMLNRYVGGELQFEWTHGRDFPEELASFKLIIHCGACTWNRRSVLSRLLRAQEAGVPITNYGLCIAYSLKIFNRALEPFPIASEIYRNHLQSQQNSPD